MFTHHLRSGATSTCGKASCRTKYATAVPRKRLNGPRAMNLEQIQKAWATYHSPELSKQRSIPQLALRHKVNVYTLNDIFATVRDVGGIEDYTALVTKEKPLEHPTEP